MGLRTLNVDEWPDTGNLVVNVPPGIAGTIGSTLVLQATWANKGNKGNKGNKDPPPPPPPKPSPSDHLDLELDVEVK